MRAVAAEAALASVVIAAAEVLLINDAVGDAVAVCVGAKGCVVQVGAVIQYDRRVSPAVDAGKPRIGAAIDRARSANGRSKATALRAVPGAAAAPRAAHMVRFCEKHPNCVGKWPQRYPVQDSYNPRHWRALSAGPGLPASLPALGVQHPRGPPQSPQAARLRADGPSRGMVDPADYNGITGTTVTKGRRR